MIEGRKPAGPREIVATYEATPPTGLNGVIGAARAAQAADRRARRRLGLPRHRGHDRRPARAAPPVAGLGSGGGDGAAR